MRLIERNGLPGPSALCTYWQAIGVLSCRLRMASSAQVAASFHEEPKGLLRVVAPPRFGPWPLVPTLRTFQDKYPLLAVEFLLTAHHSTLEAVSLNGNSKWTLVGPHGNPETVATSPVLFSDSMEVTMAAALNGMGIAVLPEGVAMPSIRQGNLVHILPEWGSPTIPIYALYAAVDRPFRKSVFSSIISPTP